MNNRIRILTINTWKCDGDYFTRIKVLSDQLKSNGCDVIVCQECFKTDNNRINTIEFLAMELDMNFIFTAARAKIRSINNKKTESFSGLGILSRFPLVMPEEFDLSTSNADGGRKAQFGAIEIGDGLKILIANIHLTFLKDAGKLRQTQLIEIAQKLQLQNLYKYRLICGDFNAEESAPEIEYFKKCTGAADCYVLGNGPDLHLSGSGFNNFQISRRIDHIFSLPVNDAGDYPGFHNSNIVLNTPDPTTGLYASDHFGIVTELVIE